MSDELTDLKQDYRAIEAPPGFASRVSAQVQEAGTGPAWWPRYAAAAAMLLLALPLLFNTDQSTLRPGTSIPSISQLAPERPEGSMSSLGSLRSVSLPAMPSRPPSPAKQSDTEPEKRDNTQLEQSSNKENFHEYA